MTSTPVLQCGLLAVQFARSGDRYSHRIELRFDGRAMPLLESIEGTPEDEWPASPPLQQLQIERRKSLHPEGEGAGPAQAVALLVGMAGRSHWSLGVEPIPESEARRTLTPTVSQKERERARGWQFDVACRLRSAAGQLGSRYRLLAPAEIDPQTGNLVFAAGGPECRLQVDGVDGRLARIELADFLLSVKPPTAGGISTPQTIRWRYSICHALE